MNTGFIAVDVLVSTRCRAPRQSVIGRVGAAIDGQEELRGRRFFVQPFVFVQVERVGAEIGRRRTSYGALR